MYVVCDLCGHLPEFSPGSEWSNRAKVMGGCFVFVVYVAVSLGSRSVRTRKQIKHDEKKKNGMIKINGALTGSILLWVTSPQQSHLRLQECTTHNQLNNMPHRIDLLNTTPPLPSASTILPRVVQAGKT